MVLVSKRFPVYNLMQTKTDWSLVYDDDLCGLFVRSNSPLRQTLADTKIRDDLDIYFP